ncbi:hypothetical protein [Caulobacter segnis]|uniref:hypothetical protein n=1 Tax=Caulobacter segnis TaxID=88688 RepID=UPI002864960C|nr:hypothetical protein [Caulobacter segnis]MDR6626870.1 putative lipoprotein with Yx(FWY)xxD motif [Caulobacter segnis]
MPRPLIVGTLVGLCLIAAESARAQSSAPPLKVGQTTKGLSLVDEADMTLYVFAKDTLGKSACNDPCTRNWPLEAKITAVAVGDYTLITPVIIIDPKGATTVRDLVTGASERLDYRAP